MSRKQKDEYILKYVDVGVGSYWGEGFDVIHEKDGGRVSIGNWTSIGYGVKVYCGGYHHVDWVTTSPIREDRQSTYSKGDVHIGSDVWIGDCAIIMSGVSIGHGAVIGAYSVVTKDIAPYTIAAGNPAAVKRYRFSVSHSVELLRIAWWNWPETLVRERQLELCQPDIQAFIDKYKVE